MHKTVVAVCPKEYAAVQNLRVFFFLSGKDSSYGQHGYDNVTIVLKECAIPSYTEDSGSIFLGNTGTNLPDCLVA